jgi:hypothetical protein
MRTRAERRFFHERAKARFRRYILDTWNGSDPNSWTGRQVYGPEPGQDHHELVPDWEENREAWITKTVQHRAEHPKHFCTMCKGHRYRRIRHHLNFEEDPRNKLLEY